jgi:hypothetical protein
MYLKNQIEGAVCRLQGSFYRYADIINKSLEDNSNEI